jgi:hypothetical protein
VPRPSVFVHQTQAALFPAYGLEALFFKVTTGNNIAQRLATLLPGGVIPLITDEAFTGPSAPLAVGTRPLNHCFIQNSNANATTLFVTWDNNTAPVVGGPGREVQPGQILELWNAGVTLLRPRSVGIYQVNNLTAIQLISAAAIPLQIWFCD